MTGRRCLAFLGFELAIVVVSGCSANAPVRETQPASQLRADWYIVELQAGRESATHVMMTITNVSKRRLDQLRIDVNSSPPVDAEFAVYTKWQNRPIGTLATGELRVLDLGPFGCRIPVFVRAEDSNGTAISVNNLATAPSLLPVGAEGICKPERGPATVERRSRTSR